MSKKSKAIATTVIASMVGVGMTAGVMTANAAPAKNVEKCYGIVKKGKNDCQGPGHACAGQATSNGNPQEWMYVMKGNCDKIVGGSTEPGKGGNSK